MKIEQLQKKLDLAALAGIGEFLRDSHSDGEPEGYDIFLVLDHIEGAIENQVEELRESGDMPESTIARVGRETFDKWDRSFNELRELIEAAQETASTAQE